MTKAILSIHRHMATAPGILGGALFSIFALTSVAPAQTGAPLLLKPWQDEQAVEVEAESLFLDQGHTRDSDQDFQLQWYEATGRWRFDETNPDSPAVGADLLYINLQTAHPALPERLVDQSVAAGFGLMREGDWEIGMTVGAGYAGNNPYADSDAVYGLANLIGSYRINEKSSLLVILNYDGNRTIFPDVPLPAVGYQHRVSRELSYIAGIPFGSIYWRPGDRWQVQLDYAFPYTANVRADYRLTEAWGVFAAFHNRFNAFHVEEMREHERLFFEQKRVEGGLRWEPCESFGLTLAGGLAFDQEFNRGFDARDLEDTIEVSDEPYVRLALEVAF